MKKMKIKLFICSPKSNSSNHKFYYLSWFEEWKKYVGYDQVVNQEDTLQAFALIYPS